MQLSTEAEVAPQIGAHQSAYSRSRTNYYVIISVVAMIIVIAGFAMTYLVPMTTSKSFVLRPMVHAHAIMYFAWMLLFILQPVLVRMGNTRLHRKTGVAGFILAGGMVIMGVITAITGAKLNSPALTVGGLTAKQFLIVPITDMILLTTFLSIALLQLRNPEAHKRLMILATLSVVPAAIGRIAGVYEISNPFILLFIQHGILYSGLIFDFVKRRKIHPVYIWGGLLLVGVHLVRFPLATTEWWQSVATWLVD